MSFKMGWFHVVFISLCVFKGTLPFQWTSTRSDGAVMHICRGHDLHMPLTYTLSDGQQVANIQWYFRGQSEEMVAMMNSHGQFVPMPAFANRVEFVPPAGIVVKNVVPSDSGNYTVEVISHTGPNIFPEQHFTTVIDVIDPPSSAHDVLTVTQERSAVYNNNTDQWAIGLTCGKFSSLGQPPVDVVWTTPTGEKKASTSFRDGSFFLTLDNPPTGGTYSCVIASPSSSVAVLCLSPSSGLLHHGEVIVDEARQEAEITRLQQQNQQLTSYIERLEHNLTMYIQKCDGHMQGINTGPCADGNHTVLDDAWRDVNHISGGGICDDHLDAGWYRFLLNGHNAVMPTSCVLVGHCGTMVTVWLDLEGRPMPDLGQQTTGRAYGSLTSDTTNTGSCRQYQNTSVTVLNCGAFYVYHLLPTTACNLVYCATAVVH